jgi:ribosomal protein L11 methyltransferase
VVRLAVRCAPEQAERVLAELVELAPGGVEEERGEGYVEYAIYGPPGELPELPDVEAAAGEGLVAIETTEIPDDWADRWRDFHQPAWIGGRLVVRPSWIEDAIPGADLEIVIDPGRAFGTGAHATTALCLELLLELADSSSRRGPVCDLGTGSGVLAIAAAKLGFAPVSAYDHEPAAIAAAAANAALNGVSVATERINLRERAAPPAPLWLANLTAPLLLEVAAHLPTPAVAPSRLILSGMLTDEVERVGAAFGSAGHRIGAARERGEWAALLLER